MATVDNHAVPTAQTLNENERRYTKKKPKKTIGFDTYLDKNLVGFFEFLFDKADV